MSPQSYAGHLCVGQPGELPTHPGGTRGRGERERERGRGREEEGGREGEREIMIYMYRIVGGINPFSIKLLPVLTLNICFMFGCFPIGPALMPCMDICCAICLVWSAELSAPRIRE